MTAWWRFLERTIKRLGLADPLDLRFEADRYGPYANRLRHLLDGLDGSYLHCDKRIADANPFDTIWFEDSQRERLEKQERIFTDRLLELALDRLQSMGA